MPHVPADELRRIAADIIVMDIKPSEDPARFVEEVEALCARITASPPVEHCDGVTLPGDRAAGGC